MVGRVLLSNKANTPQYRNKQKNSNTDKKSLSLEVNNITNQIRNDTNGINMHPFLDASFVFSFFVALHSYAVMTMV